MTTEVQRIIALSLNKIVSSRSRRGGISLHRNLLVASVLLRAKDAYIAETVAKRKQDINHDAVHKASEEDSGLLSDSVEDMDTDIPCACDESLDEESNSNDLEIERRKIVEQEELHKADEVLVASHSDIHLDQVRSVESDDSCLSEDLSLEQFCTDLTEMNNTSVTKRCNRKRQFSELEQAVFSIGGQLNADTTCTCAAVCSCSTQDSSVKRSRVESVCEMINEQLDCDSSSTTKSRDTNCLTYSHSVNISQNNLGHVCLHNEISQTLSEQSQKLNGYRSVHGLCPVEAKSLYTAQVSLSSPSILVATM